MKQNVLGILSIIAVTLAGILAVAFLILMGIRLSDGHVNPFKQPSIQDKFIQGGWSVDEDGIYSFGEQEVFVAIKDKVIVIVIASPSGLGMGSYAAYLFSEHYKFPKIMKTYGILSSTCNDKYEDDVMKGDAKIGVAGCQIAMLIK